MTKLASRLFKSHIVDQLVESITESANNAYYLYVGQHINRSDSTLPTPTDSISEIQVDAYRSMLFGKRISSSDVKPMVRNNSYVSDTVFDMYDDTATNLHDYETNFYCVVDETSYFHVYKCLDNNFGANSTAQPTFAHITGSNTDVYQTSDGYRWKYMYSFSSSDNDKFSTITYMPITPNTTVTSGAVNGSIDIVKIEEVGRNYNNYTSGTFQTTDVRISGNSVLYKVSNTNLNQSNGFLTGCLIYITSGDGSGEYRDIDNYFANSSGSYVVVNSAFSNAPSGGSTYEINPRIVINGTGVETTVAIGRGLVNSTAANSLFRIEMLNRGEGYEYATANAIANSVVGVTIPAELRVIMPPKGGHGYDPQKELGCNHLGVGITLSNTEANTIPAMNTFEKVGIIRDPVFANVYVELQSTNGVFSNSETIYKINPIRIQTNVSINTTSAALTCSTGDFANQFSVGDFVYISDSNNHMITTIDTITNSTYMNVESNGFFVSSEANLYIPNITTTAQVIGLPNADHIVINSVIGTLSTDDRFVGVGSGAHGVVNNTIRNDVQKGFENFVQMYKYKIQVTRGTFSGDEQIYQGSSLSNSTANGYLHSVITLGANTLMYISNQVGTVNSSAVIEGATSGASAVILNKYNPELVIQSGDVLSLENVDTISRSNTQSESFKIIFEF